MARDLEAELEEIANDPERSRQFDHAFKISCVLMIVIVGLLVLASRFGGSQTSPPSPPPSATTWRDDSTSNLALALAFAQQTVREQLRSPSTARFPSSMFADRETRIHYLGEQRYRVESWADAQDAFGATMRVDYVAKVQQVSKDRWVLHSLDTTQR